MFDKIFDKFEKFMIYLIFCVGASVLLGGFILFAVWWCLER